VPNASIPRGYAEEGASISIKGLQPTASSVRSFVAPASDGSSFPPLGGTSLDALGRLHRPWTGDPDVLP
jgi:hypothetical protein